MSLIFVTTYSFLNKFWGGMLPINVIQADKR